MRLSPLGTSATNRPIVPALDYIWWVWSSLWNENWQGRHVLGENLPQCHFFHHKSHITYPGLEHGPPRWQPATGGCSCHYLTQYLIVRRMESTGFSDITWLLLDRSKENLWRALYHYWQVLYSASVVPFARKIWMWIRTVYIIEFTYIIYLWFSLVL
jgi:hypothetical protein